jgi:DmsE family decaheme c-type cytochrome
MRAPLHRRLETAMRRLILLILIGLLPVAISAQETPPVEPAAPEATPAVEETEATVMACGDCHTDQAAAFTANPHHAIKANTANAACESCHGDGKAHMEAGGDTTLIKIPRGRDGADNVCLSCHDKATEHVSRRGGMHANSAAVNCFTCHSIHSSTKTEQHLLKKNELDLCTDCHSGQAASMRNKPYAHRVGRGGMECSTCHDPHGRRGRESLKQTASGEAACMNCHSDKRAMHVFAHGAGSVGDCTSCHETHGSSNPRQLKRANVAQLCIECHSPIGAVATLASQPPSFHNLSLARYQNCTTCHTAIHGSNRSPKLLK